MVEELAQLRQRWWQLVAAGTARRMHARDIRRAMRDLAVTDASGAVWRIDPRSTPRDVRFTRQVPGRVAEPADPAAFVAPLGPPRRQDLQRLADALAGADPASAVAQHGSPRRTARAIAALGQLVERGARLQALEPRPRGDRYDGVLVVVEADGTSNAEMRVELVEAAGAWKLARWPVL